MDSKLIGVVFLVSLAWIPRVASTQDGTYLNPEHGFSMDLPAGWKVVAPKPQKDSELKRQIVSIRNIVDFPKEMPRVTVSCGNNWLELIAGGEKILSNGVVLVNGENMAWFTTQRKNGATFSKQYYLKRDHRTYRIAYFAGSNKLYEKRLAEFDTMIQSLAWSSAGKSPRGFGGKLTMDEQAIGTILKRLEEKDPDLLKTLSQISQWKLEQTQDTSITKQKIENGTKQLIKEIHALRKNLFESGSVQKSAELRKSLKSAMAISIYEGLPHQATEGDLLIKELKRKDIIKIGDYWFYKPPLIVEQRAADPIKSLLSRSASFSVLSGIPADCLFHPDFAIKWKAGDQDCFVLICYGCSEAMFIAGDQKQEYGIGKIKKDLQKMFKPFSAKRPRR